MVLGCTLRWVGELAVLLVESLSLVKIGLLGLVVHGAVAWRTLEHEVF